MCSLPHALQNLSDCWEEGQQKRRPRPLRSGEGGEATTRPEAAGRESWGQTFRKWTGRARRGNWLAVWGKVGKPGVMPGLWPGR